MTSFSECSIALQREGDRERAKEGMRNWALRRNLRYKDNGHLICFYIWTILNSWRIFAVI